jgi:hypothetical protein
MNEVDSIRLEGFRQLKKQIRGSKDYLIVGIDEEKGVILYALGVLILII